MAEELTSFEKARALIIARNKARLAVLGIHEAANVLGHVAPSQGQKTSRSTELPSKKRQKRHDAQGVEGTSPTRRSKRLRAAVHVAHLNRGAVVLLTNDIPSFHVYGHSTTGSVDAAEAPHNDEPSESQKQLASFMINGVCPKCKRVVTRGHKKHLHTCSGATQRPQKSLADMIKTEMAEIETDNAKLQELELGGLIEFDDARAVYMVVGSTGRHYQIEFTEDNRKCQCPDHRIRKRDCKHIRLLLKSLGVEHDPSQWKTATACLVNQQAAQINNAVNGEKASYAELGAQADQDITVQT